MKLYRRVLWLTLSYSAFAQGASPAKRCQEFGRRLYRSYGELAYFRDKLKTMFENYDPARDEERRTVQFRIVEREAALSQLLQEDRALAERALLDIAYDPKEIPALRVEALRSLQLTERYPVAVIRRSILALNKTLEVAPHTPETVLHLEALVSAYSRLAPTERELMKPHFNEVTLRMAEIAANARTSENLYLLSSMVKAMETYDRPALISFGNMIYRQGKISTFHRIWLFARVSEALEGKTIEAFSDVYRRAAESSFHMFLVMHFTNSRAHSDFTLGDFKAIWSRASDGNPGFGIKIMQSLESSFSPEQVYRSLPLSVLPDALFQSVRRKAPEFSLREDPWMLRYIHELNEEGRRFSNPLAMISEVLGLAWEWDFRQTPQKFEPLSVEHSELMGLDLARMIDLNAKLRHDLFYLGKVDLATVKILKLALKTHCARNPDFLALDSYQYVMNALDELSFAALTSTPPHARMARLVADLRERSHFQTVYVPGVIRKLLSSEEFYGSRFAADMAQFPTPENDDLP